MSPIRQYVGLRGVKNNCGSFTAAQDDSALGEETECWGRDRDRMVADSEVSSHPDNRAPAEPA